MDCNTLDYGPNHISMSQIGSITCTTDRFGNSGGALYFSGSSSLYGSHASFPTTTRSVSMWIKPNSLQRTDGKGHSLFCYGYAGTVGQAFLFTLNCPPSFCGGSITAQNSVLNVEAGSGIKRLLGNVPDPVGKWTHVVVTTESSGTRIYINGALVSSNSLFITSQVAGNYFSVGSLTNGGNVPYIDSVSGQLQGALDDVRIYSRALSASEVSTLFASSPSVSPSVAPTAVPSVISSVAPTIVPSVIPSVPPTLPPSIAPPSFISSASSSVAPTAATAATSSTALSGITYYILVFGVPAVVMLITVLVLRVYCQSSAKYKVAVTPVPLTTNQQVLLVQSNPPPLSLNQHFIINSPPPAQQQSFNPQYTQQHPLPLNQVVQLQPLQPQSVAQSVPYPTQPPVTTHPQQISSSPYYPGSGVTMAVYYPGYGPSSLPDQSSSLQQHKGALEVARKKVIDYEIEEK